MRQVGFAIVALSATLVLATPAAAGELVNVPSGLTGIEESGSATPEELAESGKGSSKAKTALKVAKAVSSHPVVRVATFPLTVNNYAKAGWELGRLTSKHDPGPYPGFKKAVLPKKKGR